jgi:hypothetical protein
LSHHVISEMHLFRQKARQFKQKSPFGNSPKGLA